MSFGTAVRTVLGKYATFSGRARRAEYWWWTLAYGLVFTVLYIIVIAVVGVSAFVGTDGGTTAPDAAAGGALGAVLTGLLGLFVLATFLPSLAVIVRRLHDTSRSGWWYLLSFVPFGSIVILVFSVMDSTPGTNTYGPNPKGVGDGGFGGQGYGAPQPYGQDPRFGTPPQG